MSNAQTAFGESAESSAYADGNGDGTIDAADYILWRKERTSLNAASANVPEPVSCSFAAVAL